MTLSCSKPFQSRTYGPGIYISEATILDAKDESGVEQPFGRAFDCAIRLRLDIGREFEPELLIGGDFKHDLETNEVIGWGSAFVVQEALARLGYTGELAEGNQILTPVLESLVGKKFYRLSYVSGIKEGGKNKYSDWNQIASLEDGAEDLAQRFKRSLTKGYPRNYHGDFLGDPRPVPVPVQVSDDDPF